MKTKEDIVVSRPILDRIAANQPFLSAIVVLEGNKVLKHRSPLWE